MSLWKQRSETWVDSGWSPQSSPKGHPHPHLVATPIPHPRKPGQRPPAGPFLVTLKQTWPPLGLAGCGDPKWARRAACSLPVGSWEPPTATPFGVQTPEAYPALAYCEDPVNTFARRCLCLHSDRMCPGLWRPEGLGRDG